MNKTIPILIIISLVLSGLGATALSEDIINGDLDRKQKESYTISIPPIIIENSNEKYLNIHLKDISSYVMNYGKPILPKIVKTIELPFGVRNIKVDVIPTKIQEQEIYKKIEPSPPLLTLNTDTTQQQGGSWLFTLW